MISQPRPRPCVNSIKKNFLPQAVNAHANAKERGQRALKDAGRLTGLREETEEEFWARLQREEENYEGPNTLDVSGAEECIEEGVRKRGGGGLEGDLLARHWAPLLNSFFLTPLLCLIDTAMLIALAQVY